ncbi:hypothetical protein BMS3Abin16_01305 [archaeon BMS3Abin16]|nr:hypothetical protein BMS3Abin16_01305 [archaeon BMS3Abin16]HDZ62496.1 hypothetical protein [Nitrospirota bacterium]
MKRTTVILFLFLIPAVWAQSMSGRVYRSSSYADVQATGDIQIELEITGTVSSDVSELFYTHRISNRENDTQTLYLEYNLDSEPEILSIDVNGEKIVPTLVSKTTFYANYQVPLSIGRENVTVKSHLKFRNRPQEGRGLWKERFFFSNPVNIAPVFGPPRAKTMEGSIILPEDAQQVQCDNCNYDSEDHVVRFKRYNEPPYLSFNFQVKKKPPVKAGIIYILMQVVFLVFVIMKRKKTL